MSDRRSDRNQDPPTDGLSDDPMWGPGLRPRNCPTDTTTDRTTDTRKVGHNNSDRRTDGPIQCEQGIMRHAGLVYLLASHSAVRAQLA
jgi:hypothetical protein